MQPKLSNNLPIKLKVFMVLCTVVLSWLVVFFLDVLALTWAAGMAGSDAVCRKGCWWSAG